jgi:hypothetical protein
MFPTGTFLVVFDADHAGRRGGALLGAHLAALSRGVVLSAPPRTHNDLNDWWKTEPAALVDALAGGARPGLYQPDAAAAKQAMPVPTTSPQAESRGSPPRSPAHLPDSWLPGA